VVLTNVLRSLATSFRRAISLYSYISSILLSTDTRSLLVRSTQGVVYTGFVAGITPYEGLCTKDSLSSRTFNRDPVQHRQELSPLERQAVFSRITISSNDRADDQIRSGGRQADALDFVRLSQGDPTSEQVVDLRDLDRQTLRMNRTEGEGQVDLIFIDIHVDRKG
jgi:hypothetical protein